MSIAALVAVAVMAAEPPKRGVETLEPGAAAETGATAPEEAEAPPEYGIFVNFACVGVSLPFSWGVSGSPKELKFDGAAFEVGLECGYDFPNAEIRLSYDYRKYDVNSADGTWECSALLLCGGWRGEINEGLDLVLGGGVGAVLNSAARVKDSTVDEDPASFAARLYCCIRYSPAWPIEFELYGRLTFAGADYETLGQSGTMDLSMGSIGLSAQARF